MNCHRQGIDTLPNKGLVSAVSVCACDEVRRTAGFAAMGDHSKRLVHAGAQRQTKQAERRSSPKI